MTEVTAQKQKSLPLVDARESQTDRCRRLLGCGTKNHAGTRGLSTKRNLSIPRLFDYAEATAIARGALRIKADFERKRP